MSQRERTFHVIPFFHYDVAYLRTRTEYLKAAFDILDEMVVFLNSGSDATFLLEQPYLVQEWLSVRPEMRDILRRFAEEGRLDVSPGLYVMPDMAMISGEWMNLQAETGLLWCIENLGIRPSVCWIPDPWNHPASLPAWLARCGYEAYVFSRGANENHPNHFRWRGIDGTETLGVRLPLHYDRFTPSTCETESAMALFADYVGRLDALFPPGHPVLVPVGGDFAPPSNSLTALLEKAKDNGYKVEFSTLPRFITALKEFRSQLPVVPADFSPTFQGTFSSRSALKTANRTVENRVDFLQRYEAAGGSTTDEWRTAISMALVQQSHDTICGTVIDAAAKESAEEFAEILGTLNEAVEQSSEGGSRYVFNPSAEPRSECVFLPGWNHATAQDDAGRPIPVQRVEGGAVLYCDCGPLQTQTLVPGSYDASDVSYPDCVIASETFMENSHLRLDLDYMGNITQLRLKGVKEDTRFLSGGRPLFNTLSLEHDFGDFWIIGHQPLNGRYTYRMPNPDPLPLSPDPHKPWIASAGSFSDRTMKEVKLLESGPLRARLLVTGVLRLQGWSVEFEQTVTLHAASPRLDFTTVLKPSARNARVRVSFIPNLGNASPYYGVPFGMVQREPSQHAAFNGVSLDGTQAGMLLLNKGIPGTGWDGHVLSLSLLRCVAMEYKGPSVTGYEEGTEHRFEYAVLPFRAADSPGLCREGARFNQPLSEIPQVVPGPPFSIDASPGVEITRLERVVGGYRIHGHESRGARATISITSPGGWIGPLDVTGELLDEPTPDALAFSLNPFELFMYGVVTDDEPTDT